MNDQGKNVTPMIQLMDSIREPYDRYMISVGLVANSLGSGEMIDTALRLQIKYLEEIETKIRTWVAGHPADPGPVTSARLTELLHRWHNRSGQTPTRVVRDEVARYQNGLDRAVNDRG